MRTTIEIAEEIEGRFEQVPLVLRLHLDDVVRAPLDELRVPLGAGSVGRRVRPTVGAPCLGGRTMGVAPGTLEIALRWRAAQHPRLFPTMNGRLRISDAGRRRIEVRLIGKYTPPFGPLGALLERLTGHRAATTSLVEYVRGVAGRLSRRLDEHTPIVPPATRLGTIERSP